jgi:6-pyruvoyltetrahydropterin/6-carboxytetrahydropterin synthase
LHGHRYALEITLAGDIIEAHGQPINGMLMDFSEVKILAQTHLVDAWDHAFLAYRNDSMLVQLLGKLPDHKTVLLDAVPTAENLAAIAYRTLASIYHNRYGASLRLENVRLYETPNCWADCRHEDSLP